jgi:hypothetical protein
MLRQAQAPAARHLAKNKIRIEFHPVFFQQHEKFRIKIHPSVMRLLILYVTNHNGGNRTTYAKSPTLYKLRKE